MVSWGHEYYFGFVELAYDAETERFEGTMVLSAHDVEDWLQDQGVLIAQMEDLKPNTDLMSEVQEKLFSGFQLSFDHEAVHNQIVGVEVLTNGMVHFYFQSEPIHPTSALNIQFDLLMDYFPDQQNKITYLKDGIASVAVFTKNSPTGIIEVL